MSKVFSATTSTKTPSASTFIC